MFTHYKMTKDEGRTTESVSLMIAAMMIILTLVAGCGEANPTATSTLVQPTAYATSEPTAELTAAPSADTPAPYLEKVASTPDLMQTDPTLELISGGRTSCASVSITNAFAWLAEHGFDALLLQDADGEPSLAQTAQELNRVLEIAQTGGALPPALLRGLSRYLSQRGYADGDYQLEFQGWYQPGDSDGGVLIPDINAVKRGLVGDSAVWLFVGFYDEQQDEYKLISHHYVTLVGHGVDERGNEDPNVLIVHDPAPRSGDGVSHDYVSIERIEGGTIAVDPDARFAGAYPKLPIDAAGYYKLGGGLKYNPKADVAILDGVVMLRMESETSFPAATATPTVDDETATLSSLELVDDYPLYTMRYYGDYGRRRAAVEETMLASPAWACSLFAALGDADNMLYGRNFDWRYSPALLLFTDPPDGYASVSMVDIEYLVGADKAGTLSDLSLDERRPLLDAPFWPFDGMNEHGLVIGMAAVPPGNVPPDPDKETIDSLMVMRQVLDHARDVDQAVTILQSCNIDWGSGPDLHYLVADPSGRSVLVEFYQGEMVLIPNEEPWHLATNFLRASVGESAAGPGLSSVEGPGLSADGTSGVEGRCWRYDRIGQRLAEAEGQTTTQDAMNLLSQVSQENTQWSIVYGMSTGDVTVSMGQEYDSQHVFHLSFAGE